MKSLTLSLIAAILACSTTVVRQARADYAVETLSAYSPGDLPEGIAVRSDGSIYTSIGTTGEIRFRSPGGSESALASLPFSPLGLDIDDSGTVYAAVFSNWLDDNTPPDPSIQGVWTIEPDGTATRFVELPVDAFPNDVLLADDGSLFVSDSLMGRVFRVASDGTAEEWLTSSLLLPDPNSPFPVGVGANGMVFSGDSLLINNLTAGSIVQVPVQPNGTAGTPSVLLSDPALVGADGLAIDQQDNLYIANIATDSVLRIDAGGTIDVLADGQDGLDGPSSLEVAGNNVLFVNSGLVTALNGGTPTPSLMRVVVPEPASLTLLWCFGATLIARRPKRS